MKIKLAATAVALAAGAIVAPTPAAAAAPVFNTKPNVVEVVNKLPRDWPVKESVAFIDRYTGSKMKLVSRCSGNARRCITIKQGRLKNTAGWSKGSTITIDVYRTKHIRGWKGYYGKATKRWLVAHELGHQRGLSHKRNCATVMDSRTRCGRPKHVPPLRFDAAQRRTLANQ